jgi:hypothetical protein
VDHRHIRNQTGANGKIGFVLPARTPEHLWLAADCEAVSGTFAGPRFCGERGELGGGMFDGLYRDVWHRHAGVSSLVIRRFVARGERNRGLADFLESFPARVGDPFRSPGGQVRQGLTPHSP